MKKIIDEYTDLPISKARKWHLRNPERVKSQQKTWKKSVRGKELIKINYEKFVEENPEKIKQYAKKYYLANKEKVKARSLKYYYEKKLEKGLK